MDAQVTTEPATTQTLRQRRQKWLVILTVALIVVALLVGAWWLFYGSHYQNTDDAYVAGDLVNVMPQVSGTVVSIGADETDLVKAGQELIKLDPTDMRIALQDAEQLEGAVFGLDLRLGRRRRYGSGLDDEAKLRDHVVRQLTAEKKGKKGAKRQYDLVQSRGGSKI